MAVAEGNLEKARRTLHTAWGFLAAISAVLSAGALAACLMLPMAAWPRFPGLSPNAVRWALLLLGLYTILGIHRAS